MPLKPLDSEIRSKAFQISGINHLGLAAKDARKARWFFHEVLGLDILGQEIVASQKTETVMLSSQTPGQDSLAPARLEILIPAPEGEGPIAKYLATKGGGIHHLALTVDHIESALAYLKERGIKLIDESPRPGAHATRIAFVHPADTGGFLVELVEESASHT